MSEEFSKAFWEERYRTHTAVCRRRPNPQLVAEAGDLVPGTALDAGCGEGADAIWLASHGWRVTAVDFATTALRRAREHAETLDAAITSRIDWVPADLTSWTPTEEHFDLVSAHYVHPAAPREALCRRLAASVAPGGTLLIVGHHPSDPHTTAHASAAEVSFTAEEVASSLDPDRWDIAVAEARSRPGHRPRRPRDRHSRRRPSSPQASILRWVLARRLLQPGELAGRVGQGNAEGDLAGKGEVGHPQRVPNLGVEAVATCRASAQEVWTRSRSR